MLVPGGEEERHMTRTPYVTVSVPPELAHDLEEVWGSGWRRVFLDHARREVERARMTTPAQAPALVTTPITPPASSPQPTSPWTMEGQQWIFHCRRAGQNVIRDLIVRVSPRPELERHLEKHEAVEKAVRFLRLGDEFIDDSRTYRPATDDYRSEGVDDT
jgi:hypothetical protein